MLHFATDAQAARLIIAGEDGANEDEEIARRDSLNLSHLIGTCNSCQRKREMAFEMEMCFRRREAK